VTNVSDDELIRHAADHVAKARVESLKLGISPNELAGLLLDDAVMGLYMDGMSRREASQFFRDFTQRRVPHWYNILPGRY
jgi:hypothetical protein